MSSRAPAVAIPVFLALLVGATLGAAGCSGGSTGNDAQPTCLATPADGACKDPLYQPTFHELFTNTLQPTCGANGCHSGSNPQGGLQLGDTEQVAYAALMANDENGMPRVTANDLSCGQFIVRLETPGKPWSMPFGSHLDPQKLCVIQQWIAQGAKP
jgi:hypothetical protein